MKRALSQFHHPQHAQAGENPELRALFIDFATFFVVRSQLYLFIWITTSNAQAQPACCHPAYLDYTAVSGLYSRIWLPLPYGASLFLKKVLYRFSLRMLSTWRSRS